MENGVFNRVLGLEKDTSSSNTRFGFGGGRKTIKKIKYHKRTKKNY